ncbi:MAG: N-acetylmuramic acid 6-phosphate etherase [Bacteroidota bacterium]
MQAKTITETASHYDSLEQMPVEELLRNINREDQRVALAVEEVIPTLTDFVERLAVRFSEGGRLFYIGAGTSGRLGILDASEIPPTFGLPHERVIGLIAGGDRAIRKAVEQAEDQPERAVADLQSHSLAPIDTVVGIAASGTTPYVLGGIEYARELGCLTAGLTNNPGAPLALAAEVPIEVVVGPEFVTGSTRMKSGTAQKLVLNMISTSLMIRIGRVKGNKMVNMQLNNDKLVDRGIRFLIDELSVDREKAAELLEKHGSVRAAIEAEGGR